MLPHEIILATIGAFVFGFLFGMGVGKILMEKRPPMSNDHAGAVDYDALAAEVSSKYPRITAALSASEVRAEEPQS
jgi:hypothetical protein